MAKSAAVTAAVKPTVVRTVTKPVVATPKAAAKVAPKTVASIKIATPLSKAATKAALPKAAPKAEAKEPRGKIVPVIMEMLRAKKYTDEQIIQSAECRRGTLYSCRYTMAKNLGEIYPRLIEDANGKLVPKVRGEKKLSKSVEAKATLAKVTKGLPKA